MNISAVILAAGKSVRMGQPKMLMPWGETTVLGRVIQTLQSAGVESITLVTNSAILAQIPTSGMEVALNDHGVMLESIQIGLRMQNPAVEAVLVCLGDQPQISLQSIAQVCTAYFQHKARLVVPSYQMRRGHPWLIVRELWDEILSLQAPSSMRDFLNAHQTEIHYVNCDTPDILQDLDTMEDYLKYKP